MRKSSCVIQKHHLHVVDMWPLQAQMWASTDRQTGWLNNPTPHGKQRRAFFVNANRRGTRNPQKLKERKSKEMRAKFCIESIYIYTTKVPMDRTYILYNLSVIVVVRCPSVCQSVYSLTGGHVLLLLAFLWKVNTVALDDIRVYVKASPAVKTYGKYLVYRSGDVVLMRLSFIAWQTERPSGGDSFCRQMY